MAFDFTALKFAATDADAHAHDSPVIFPVIPRAADE